MKKKIDYPYLIIVVLLTFVIFLGMAYCLNSKLIYQNNQPKYILLDLDKGQTRGGGSGREIQ